ncbi:helix-turn-helix domain-containing protein [Nocardiopsis dassonvillei]|uniref:helix-turn-helix domain-containing protein n=1 Tax=Nocardiopsis dassonvillei TaxID=2014 RepID=UPI003632233F
MSQNHETPKSPTEVIAQRVKEVRRKRGLSAAALAAKMTEAGVPWDRGILANLENGRRRNVSVTELFALAYVLDVSPLHLAVPLEDEAPYLFTPEREVPAVAARRLIRGFHHLPEQDWRAFITEVPESEAVVSDGHGGWTIKPDNSETTEHRQDVRGRFRSAPGDEEGNNAGR